MFDLIITAPPSFPATLFVKIEPTITILQLLSIAPPLLVALLPSKKTAGYFAEERFDRKDGKRVHMISLSGLLEASPDIPALDYLHLLKVCYRLGDERDVNQAYRLMCFNVFAQNFDDHGKNFSFLYAH